MNIVYLAFGDGMVYHIQTYFSILTVLKRKQEEDTVSVYTDNPQFYERLKPYICLETFSIAQREAWIANTGYIFRAKIKAIEDSAVHNPRQHLLFLDGDTVLRTNLDEIRSTLDKGIGVMYTDEGHPSKMQGGSLRMWKAMRGERIRDCIVCMRHNVWNSGVIGIPQGKLKEVIPLALEICDLILSKHVRCFTAEQYAFSIAMQEAGPLVSAEEWIGHYWGNKEQWLSLVSDFMLKSYMTSNTVEEDIVGLNAFPLTATPLYVNKSNTKRRLIRLLDKIFDK